MYGCTVKQMKVRFFISFVIGMILGLAMVIININNVPISAILLISIGVPLVYPFQVLGMILNWRKVFKGLLFPIPIISYLLECFIGMFMAYRAFFWLLKHWKDNDVINSNITENQ